MCLYDVGVYVVLEVHIMSYKHCCVPGCISQAKDTVLHEFPNPTKDKDRFRKWLHSTRGDILKLSIECIYKNRRVCRKHFDPKYHCRFNRLSNIAVPTINMPLRLHVFPNPKKEPERFEAWRLSVGGHLLELTNEHIYKYRRVCHAHFQEKFHCRYNRLSNIAIPTVNLAGLSKELTHNLVEDLQPSTFNTTGQIDLPLRQIHNLPINVPCPLTNSLTKDLFQEDTDDRYTDSPCIEDEIDSHIEDASQIECTNIETPKIWAAEPDVCRCCLTSNGSKDLLAANINEAGEKQVYSEILHSCFGISLSSLTAWGPGRLLCDVCVARLLDADTFKKQVLQAELLFVTYYNKQGNAKANDETVCSSTNEQNDQPDNVIDEPIHKSASIDNIDYTSETELEQSNLDISLTRSNLDKSPSTRNKDSTLEDHSYDDKDSISEDHYYDDVDNVAINVTIPSVPLKPGIKRISERKRIKKPAIKRISVRKRIQITCETILRATTACPFRHHSSWFQCFFCNQTFINISSLRTHYIHTHKDIDEVLKLKRFPRSLQIDITEFNCKLCSLNLCDVESMRAHLKEAHQLVIYKECIADYKINGSPYSCHICGEDFHVFRTLTTHLNEHYPNFICDVCGKSFMNSKRLKVHNRTHESGNFPCAQCGKVMKTKAAIDNHMETHSRRVIRCQICSKPMKHYNARIKHMSEEHNITHKFKCLICARDFKIKHNLAAHIRHTHGQKNKKCSECGMAFVTNDGLKKHMRRHSGVKAYLCELCSKAYSRIYSLRRHVMRVHT